MTRMFPKSNSCRRSRLLAAGLLLVLPLDVLFVDPAASPGPAAAAVEKPSEDGRGPLQEEARSTPARSASVRVPQRVEASARESAHRLPELRAMPPEGGSRLDYCVEFTKPDSLKIRLTGMPKSHRSPPAAPFPTAGRFIPAKESVSCGLVNDFRGC